MAISVAKLRAYIGAELNVMVSGLPGTGKTAMLTAAVDELGWTMKYFSTPTLDPFISLIGIPVPNQELKAMEFFRDKSVDEADVICFDEANRASDQVINAILEITQFRSLNGVPLPKLKSVVIAVNPAGHELSEGTEELSTAFLDRMDVYLESDVDPNYSYLKAKFGMDYARAGVTMFNDYQKVYNSTKRSSKNTLGYFSPRRLEKLMDVFKTFPEAETITAVLPADVTVSTLRVEEAFSIALGLKTPPQKPASAPAPKAPAKPVAEPNEMREQLRKAPSDFRARANAGAAIAGYRRAKMESNAMAVKYRTAAAKNLRHSVGAGTLGWLWGEILVDFTPKDKAVLFETWPAAKVRAMQEEFNKLQKLRNEGKI